MNKTPGKPDRYPVPEQDWIWGLNTLHEALLHHPRSVSEVLVQKGKGGPRLREIVELTRRNGIRLRFVEAGRLPVPPGSTHQGVAARQSPVVLLSLEALLEGVGSCPPHRLLVLDSLQDPHNLGAVLRTALAAGFTSVALTRERSAPLGGTAAKVAAGALAHLRISQITNCADALGLIKAAGFWVYGTVADPAAPSLFEELFHVPVCLVVGGEDKGIRPLVQKQCDRLVTIPMHSSFNSLNVSVAAGIAMFEVVRQQQLSTL